MSLLEVKNLSVRFGASVAISDISLSLARGERFGIIGESGSGKTLTALAITGLLPDGATMGGSVSLDHEPMPADERAMARLRGKRIGMVFQEPMTALNPLMRIGEQIGEAVALNRRGTEAGAAVTQVLAEVGLEASHARRFAHQLSGGQRQRAMIAMALASEPDLLIADEPTSALDLITQRTVLDLIAAICARRQMALLFISHDLKSVAALCDRVAVMQAGTLVETFNFGGAGPAHEAYTRRLIAASRFAVPARPRETPGEVLLQVDGVSKQYRHGGLPFMRREPVRAVDAVSFSIRSGQSMALVGPSGCGKTTLARMIVGLDKASSGQMVLDGQAYHGADLPIGWRRHMSLVFQDPFGSFDPHLTIAQSIAEPLRLEPELAWAERDARLVEAITAVGLDPQMLHRHPHAFSGGQRQRLAIARALVTRPRLVVLDEPVSALDMSVRGDVLALLARLQAEFGLTYLIISHDLDMVRAIADHVLVMEAGRIVEQGDPASIFANPQHRLTRELIAARLPELV